MKSREGGCDRCDERPPARIDEIGDHLCSNCWFITAPKRVQERRKDNE